MRAGRLSKVVTRSKSHSGAMSPEKTTSPRSFACRYQSRQSQPLIWPGVFAAASEGQRLVITAGVPFGTPGNTNVLRIAWVGG